MHCYFTLSRSETALKNKARARKGSDQMFCHGGVRRECQFLQNTIKNMKEFLPFNTDKDTTFCHLALLPFTLLKPAMLTSCRFALECQHSFYICCYSRVYHCRLVSLKIVAHPESQESFFSQGLVVWKFRCCLGKQDQHA